MALIEVNHKTLKEVAEAIDTYCETQDSEMKKAKSAVSNMLLKDWVLTAKPGRQVFISKFPLLRELQKSFLLKSRLQTSLPSPLSPRIMLP